MNSICFFASYIEGNILPYYVRYYLLELKIHCKEIVLLSSNDKFDIESLGFLSENGIQLQIEKNEGFDFGLWYKAFQSHDVEKYDRILLVNDSCVLFKPLKCFFEWSETNDSDLQGMSESMSGSRHIQSYFLILNKPIISLLKNYFREHKLLNDIKDVIRVYEIGFSEYVIKNGFLLSAFVSNNGYSGEFSPFYHLIYDHLQQGVPVIKKKIIYRSYRKDELFTMARMNFNIDRENYIDFIYKTDPKIELIDFEKVKSDLPCGLNNFQIFIYDLKKNVIQLLKKSKGIFK